MARERLRGLFWSNSPEDRAQYSLRNTIWRLKNVLHSTAFTGFSAGRMDVRLDLSKVSTDVSTVQESLATIHPDSRFCQNPRLFEEILYGFEGLDSGLDDWLREIRQKQQNDAVLRLGSVLEDHHDDPTALIPVAKALVEYDGLNELACRTLILGYHHTGAHANALSVYQALWNLLDKTYGEEPSPETQDLIVSIKSGGTSGPPEVSSGSPGYLSENLEEEPRPRIFVSEVDTSGIDKKWRHLLIGFRLELTACLIRFREWQVIDLVDLPRNRAAELVTTKSYQLALGGYNDEHEIRLSITFKDLVSGIYVWSERLERKIDSWKSLQHEVVRRLATALNIHLSAERLERISGKNDASLDTYDQWLLGQQLLLEEEPESWSRADELLHRLVNQYPDFGRGYSSLAQIENLRHISFPGIVSTEQSRTKALDYARRAVELDPLDSRAQLCMGWSCSMDGQFDRAALAFDLAHQNNENDPWTLVSAAVGLAFCDRLETSRELSRRALSMDLSPSKAHWSYQAVIFFMNEEYKKCADACELAQQVFPTILAWNSAALMALGEDALARDKLDEFLHLIRGAWIDSETPRDVDIAGWFLNCYPFRNSRTWDRLYNGLSKAGLAMPLRASPVTY